MRIRHRGRLPHWETETGSYFITFRLSDSIPRKVADSYRFERENIIKTAEHLNRSLTEYELERLAKLYSDKIESYLDQGVGECYLRQSKIAELVKISLEYFHNQRYRLYCWCIMPNHVHIAFRPFNGYSLDTLLHSWKSYTSTKANIILNRTGSLWQREYYDHLIRNEKDLERIINYIMQNPIKAGLQDWPWVKIYSNWI